jgi:hypothetical protein
VLDQPLARLGHADAARRAVGKRDAQLGLELGDLLRERGLRDVGLLRRAREAALFRERDEGSELPEIDSYSL